LLVQVKAGWMELPVSIAMKLCRSNLSESKANHNL